MEDIKVFLPFQKKNEDQRIVEGIASDESFDSQEQIVKYDAIKKALPHYLGDVDPATGSFRFGNIREMHQASAVGKTLKAVLDDVSKKLHIVVKVVDDNAWKKVKEGVYAGFSIGGRALKVVGNEIHDLVLSEISLVDRPANPAAVFSLVKFDQTGLNKKEVKKCSCCAEPCSCAEEYSEGEQIHVAQRILSLASELCYMYYSYQRDNKDTTQVEAAIRTLREMAVKELQDQPEIDEMVEMLDKVVGKKDISKTVIPGYQESWVGGYFKNQAAILK